MDLSPEKYRHDLEIIRETAAQVIRDFSMYKAEIVFSGNEYTAYSELVSQVEPVLSTMFKTNRSGFQALLYQIDISENSFRKLVQEYSGGDFTTKLAEMVVQREFQKVLTRKFFSKNL
ncbi:MAG: hypothetical protein ACO1G9_10715 [Bacteroidota bacterium]